MYCQNKYDRFEIKSFDEFWISILENFGFSDFIFMSKLYAQSLDKTTVYLTEAKLRFA
jgi:hypothetical protein